MQPWLDAPEGGWAVVVVTDGDQPAAEALADGLADAAWALRASASINLSNVFTH